MLYLTLPAFWWNKSMSCGPIVEQATHLCTFRPPLNTHSRRSVPLHRRRCKPWFGLRTCCRTWRRARPPVFSPYRWIRNSREGSHSPCHNGNLVLLLRSFSLNLSRKYNSGAVGSLTHSLLLHGEKYETQLSVFADGYSFRLVDLYTKPKLFYRYPVVDRTTPLMT